MKTQEVSMLAYDFLGPHRYVNINKLDVIVTLSEFFFIIGFYFCFQSKDHIVQLIEMLIDLEFKYKVLQCGIFVKWIWS